MLSKLQGLDERRLLDQLEELAHDLSIPVRYEAITGEEVFTTGGLCRIKDEYVIIIESRAPTEEKVRALARALKHFDLSQVYLKPALREFLESLPEERQSTTETAE
jgi:hypothetical protein